MDDDAIWDELVSDPWVRFADVVDGHSAVFGAAAMDTLEPLEGTEVLDVGCGVGGTTWQLGERLGPNGRVLGVDLSAPFIDGARQRGTAPHVSFVVGDAATIDLDPFDSAFSRFGVMFFPDPVAAFTHLRSLVRPDGAFGFSCWRDPAANPWMTVPIMASIPVLGPPQLPAPGTPGPFAFATTDTIRAMLGEAGWSNVEVSDLSVEQPFPAGDALGCAEVMTELSPVLAAGVREAPDRRADLVEVVAGALREYERAGAVVLDASAWIVHATNPG